MRNFTLADFTEDRLGSYETDLKTIADIRSEYVDCLEDFVDFFRHDIDGEDLKMLKKEITDAETKVREHALMIRNYAVKLVKFQIVETNKIGYKKLNIFDKAVLDNDVKQDITIGEEMMNYKQLGSENINTVKPAVKDLLKQSIIEESEEESDISEDRNKDLVNKSCINYEMKTIETERDESIEDDNTENQDSNEKQIKHNTATENESGKKKKHVSTRASFTYKFEYDELSET